jgi:hypothetical protein
LKIFGKKTESESEEKIQVDGISGEGWRLERDSSAFALILFEVVVRGSATSVASILASIPNFVAEMIRFGLYRTSVKRYSFNDIFKILKQNNFRIEDGVDLEEVSAFVSWIESAEHPDQ